VSRLSWKVGFSRQGIRDGTIVRMPALCSPRRTPIGELASNRCRRMSLRTRKWEAIVQMLVRKVIRRRTSKRRKTADHRRRRDRIAGCLSRSPATRDRPDWGLCWRANRSQSRRRVLEVGVWVPSMKGVMLSSVLLMGTRDLRGRAMAGSSAVGAEPIITAIEPLRLGAELLTRSR
jgi:hypothetical protein